MYSMTSCHLGIIRYDAPRIAFDSTPGQDKLYKQNKNNALWRGQI